MTKRVECQSIDDYAEALGPHFTHETYRADDIAARAMGKGCRTCGVEVTISIEAFKETGDLPRFRELTKGLAPEKKK
ncbi:MAG: hypothetical protein HYY84_02965 [Deltaproteobacteria bacterium]|nr:hypothetical protein [Deltaproteobacteria bacterium]